MQIKELLREFKYNSVKLADPNPALPLTAVRDFFANVYPEIISADIEGPEVVGNKNIYTFRRAVGTKGNAQLAPEIHNDQMMRLIDIVSGRTTINTKLLLLELGITEEPSRKTYMELAHQMRELGWERKRTFNGRSDMGGWVYEYVKSPVPLSHCPIPSDDDDRRPDIQMAKVVDDLHQLDQIGWFSSDEMVAVQIRIAAGTYKRNPDYVPPDWIAKRLQNLHKIYCSRDQGATP